MNDKTTRQMQSYTQNKAFFYYAVKKTERMARAIYLITNFFSDQEPIKWKLRQESISLLEDFSRITESTDSHTSVDLSFIKHSLRTSLATLGVAHTAGLISEMNFSILRHEYEALLDALEGELGADGKHSPLLFPKDFFEVPRDTESKRIGDGLEKYLFGTTFEKPSVQPSTREEKPLELTDSTLEDKTSAEKQSPNSPPSQNPKGHSSSLKDIKDTKRTPAANLSRTQPPGTATMPNVNRREIILQLIKDKKEITIKDVAREIQDVGEKTLQRDVSALVDENVLERVGSRRWSRYRFTSHQ